MSVTFPCPCNSLLSLASGNLRLIPSSARIRRRRRRREQRAFENERRKQPGRHRPSCNCATCTSELMGRPCWSCGASQNPPPPRHRYHPGGPPPHPGVMGPNGYPRGPPPRRNRDRRRIGRGEEVVIIDEPFNAVEDRMTSEDLRTWSLAYSLSIDVYVCAERYLMQDFKDAISAFIVNRYGTPELKPHTAFSSRFEPIAGC